MAESTDYRHLFFTSPVAHAIWDLNGAFVDCNTALCDLLGAERADLLLSNYSDVLATTSPNLDLFEELIAGDRPAVRVEQTYARKDDDEEIEGLLTAALIRDDDEPLRIIGTIEDPHGRSALRAKQILERQLRQAQKMEAVGQLAGGVAHDFNNLLSVIINYADFLAAGLDEHDPLHADAREIMKAGQRASNLVRQLLLFSRKEIVRAEVLVLNDVISNLERLLHRTISESIELTTKLEPHLWRCKIDPGHVEQILVNLAVNARDAMPSGGRLSIGTENVEVDEAWADLHPGMKAGTYAKLSVSDTGVGMSDDVTERIFEPFFTTKPRGEGTGLGLATVYGIVKSADGFVSVYSEPGMGTVFRIYLPVTEEEPAPKDEPQPPDPHHGAGETILVIEDDEPVRAVIRRTLTRAGYAVLEARSGEEAIGISGSHGGPIDLVLTDLVLQGMPGSEAAKRLEAARPDIKGTVYMSGYSDEFVVQHGVISSRAAYMEKPFTGPVLLAHVAAGLSRDSDP